MAEYTVEFLGTDETIDIPDTQTILRACIDEGIAQEYSCRVGMCLACCAEIIDGEVTQPAAHGLTAEEAENYALTCMARPRSDLQLHRGRYPPSIENDATVSDATDPTPADD